MSGIVAFHLGAGNHSEKNKLSYKRLCVQTARKLKKELSAGVAALDIVTKCTTLLENSPLTNAGIGSNLTSNGTVECDASVMDGARCISGAVGAVSGLPNPVLVAKSLAIDQTVAQPLGRVLPCILVGEGALMYASERGIPTADPRSLVTRQALKSLRKCKRKLQSSNNRLPVSVDT
ncbi:threonine aspartase [Nesidiocoris tenuis]|uniref:Threonine aspartase n=1 Tax=Nesidiocoris tenuis TaxID=355587 RepID=A0ABN7AN57_9HEMI|nr:threonine aspartase [Nesidiocoris tenuis]